jgi:hypothetical protein
MNKITTMSPTIPFMQPSNENGLMLETIAERYCSIRGMARVPD